MECSWLTLIPCSFRVKGFFKKEYLLGSSRFMVYLLMYPISKMLKIAPVPAWTTTEAAPSLRIYSAIFVTVLVSEPRNPIYLHYNPTSIDIYGCLTKLLTTCRLVPSGDRRESYKQTLLDTTGNKNKLLPIFPMSNKQVTQSSVPHAVAKLARCFLWPIYRNRHSRLHSRGIQCHADTPSFHI